MPMLHLQQARDPVCQAINASEVGSGRNRTISTRVCLRVSQGWGNDTSVGSDDVRYSSTRLESVLIEN